MRVAFVHAERDERRESGVTRYGRTLAVGLASVAGLEVVERPLSLRGESDGDVHRVESCGKSLSHVDLVHVQFSRYLWGEGWNGGQLLRRLQKSAGLPLVVTFHDVQPFVYPADSIQRLFVERFRGVREAGGGVLWTLWRAFRQMQGGVLPDRKTVHWLNRHAAAVLVCTQEEMRRLRPFFQEGVIWVIPHFIEPRNLTLERESVRRRLDLQEKKVLVIQGFIFPGKGHEVALKALALLPPDYFLVFAGGATGGGEHFVSELEADARALGVADRLRITGYLPQAALEEYLAAADLAVCPFTEMSASGSLSTWLSFAEIPVIASALPQVCQYNDLSPGAIETFQPGDPADLARTIRSQHEAHGREARMRLRELLSLERIVEQHVALYRRLQESGGRELRAHGVPAVA